LQWLIYLAFLPLLFWPTLVQQPIHHPCHDQVNNGPFTYIFHRCHFWCHEHIVMCLLGNATVIRGSWV
jgi:hypothetical protein